MNPLLREAGHASQRLVDADIRSLIETSLNWLEAMPALAERCSPGLASGMTLAQCLGIDGDELEMRHEAAVWLCEQEEFLLALPLALHCSSARGDDTRFAFMAGSCLQRLGITDYAAMMFRQALQVDECHVAATYRLGECLMALGDRASAAHLFEWAIELGRADFSLRRLQSMAQARLDTLNGG